MKRILLALSLVAAVSGIAYASAVYTQINSNGGASLSGEASTKKAALRCFVEQWPSTQYNCPSGEDCFASGGSASIPSPGRAHVANCANPIPPSQWRQCDVQLTGGGWNSFMVFEYIQGGPRSRVSTFGAPGSLQSECIISQHRLERFFEAPKQ